MASQPTSLNDGTAVEMRDVVTDTGLTFHYDCMERNNLRCKEAGQDVAYEATDAMDSEDIQCIVDPKEELHLRGIVARRPGDYTKDDSGPGRYEARAWSDSDEASNDTGAEPNS